jgi:hypothetical protein
MEVIDKILENINDDESVGGFAVDSFPKTPQDSFPKPKRKRKRQLLMTIYPESANEKLPRRAMIDLDGTIHKYSKGFGDGSLYDGAFDGAKKVIGWLKRHGFEVVIFTTRASKKHAEEYGADHEKEIRKIEQWLKDKDIYFDKITGEKLAAEFYIDDRAIHIEDGDWDTVLNVIKKRIKYKN